MLKPQVIQMVYLNGLSLFVSLSILCLFVSLSILCLSILSASIHIFNNTLYMQLIHSIHPFYDEHVFELTFNSDET